MISTPGNIRVLCRLRPGTPSSPVSSEPGPSGTVTTCYRGRQRRFRLDWVFSPEASQEEVMLCPCTCANLPLYCLRVRRGSGFPSFCLPSSWTPMKGSKQEVLGGKNDSLAGYLLSFQNIPFTSLCSFNENEPAGLMERLTFLKVNFY